VLSLHQQLDAQAEILTRLVRLKPEKVEFLLATLAALSLTRHPEQDYAL
jgi:hypothetical protein